MNAGHHISFGMSDIESQITISREERARLKAEDPSPSPRLLERMGRIGYCIYTTVAVVLVCIFLGIYFGTSAPSYTSVSSIVPRLEYLRCVRLKYLRKWLPRDLSGASEMTPVIYSSACLLRPLLSAHRW